MNKDLFNNNVPAENQLKSEGQVRFNYKSGAKINVLFVGNSMTLHGPKPEIGWNNNCGMAASTLNNDYVHQTVQMIEEEIGDVNYGIAQVSTWEIEFWNENLLKERYSRAVQFNPDILVVRAGENSVGKKEQIEQLGYEKYFDKMVKFFIAENTKIVVVTDLFWGWDKIDNAIKQVVKKNNYRFVSINDLGEQDSMKAIGLFERDSVAAHPGDLGMKNIAERIVKAILDE